MHDSSLNQIGRNMIIVILIILLSYIFTMDSVKYINKQLLFILLAFVALIIYKMINYDAYVKYTNNKINELKQLEVKKQENFSDSNGLDNILKIIEEMKEINNNLDNVNTGSETSMNETFFNNKTINSF